MYICNLINDLYKFNKMERKSYRKRIVNEQIDERTGEKIRMSVESEYIPGYVDVSNSYRSKTIQK